MTWRGAALLAASLLVVAAGAASPVFFIAGLAAFVIVATLIVVDGRRAPGPRAVRSTRDHDAVLSVGVPNRVALAVRGPRARARVREELPGAAHASSDEWRTALPAQLVYTVTPRVRGELAVGRTVVRLEGSWGLGWRQLAPGTPETLQVDADVSAVRVYEAFARRGQLAELGVRTLRLRTEGTEFERVRDAVPDDPIRSVNWRATARTGHFMATELMP